MAILSGLSWWFLAAVWLIMTLWGLLKEHKGLLAVYVAATVAFLIILTLGLWALHDMALHTESIGDDLRILLGLLGFIIVALWISQGVLATQVNVRLTARAFADADAKDALLVVALALENTGVRQTEIKVASLVVSPGPCPHWDELFQGAKRDPKVQSKNKEELGFGAPYRNEFPENRSLGSDDKYFLTWGTQETRQVAFLVPVADYYDVRFSLGTGEMGVSSVNKWRATCIVPFEKEWISKDNDRFRLVGKSIEQERVAGGNSSTLGLLKKFLGGGSGKE